MHKDLTLFFVWCWLRIGAEAARRAKNSKAYRARHPQRIKVFRIAAHLRRKKKDNQCSHNWALENKDRLRKLKTAWAKSVSGKQQRREWWKKSYSSGSRLAVMHCLRNRILSAIKGGSKSAQTEELIGCPVGQLKTHLSAQFGPGMSWENHGSVWEIDHRIPCASFDLTNPDQQRECFHFSNLQPLLVFDNRSKGSKVLAQ